MSTVLNIDCRPCFKEDLIGSAPKLEISSPALSKDISKDMSHLMFWMALLVLALANIIITTVAVPIFFFLGNGGRIVAFGLLGLLNGYLFYILLKGIPYLEPHHHFAAAIILPALSMINVFILISGLDFIAGKLNVGIEQPNIWFIVFLYIGAFLVPYIALKALK